MRGMKFILVFVFGFFGLNNCFAQFISSQLLVSTEYPSINKSTKSSTNNNLVSNSHIYKSSIANDSLYDYQIYQRYYWWPYYPGLCGYNWGFTELDGQLKGQLSALGYLPQLIYCNCPDDYSLYVDESFNGLYWRKKGTRYIYRTTNNGIGKNYVLNTSNALISKKENSIYRVVSETSRVNDQIEKTKFDIDQSTVKSDKSSKTVKNIEINSTQRILLVKQPPHGKEISTDKIRGRDQYKSNIKEKIAMNTERILEKAKNDFRLSIGTRKVYIVDKPKRQNGRENFRGIYFNRTSENTKNQYIEKSYNNPGNTQRSYSSGSGNNTQRSNSPKNSSRVSNVSQTQKRGY